VPGRASATARVSPQIDGSDVTLPVPGAQTLQLVDGRPRRYTEAEVQAAELEHAQRAGAQVERVRANVGKAFEAVRADLNAAAGGVASARVMVMAHHAQLAHQALVLQSLAAEKAFGGDKDRQDNSLRNAAGLAVVATDALNKAYEAAREEGKRANPVADLRRTIGLGRDDLGADDPGESVRVTRDLVDAGGGVPGGSGVTHAAALSPSIPPGEGVSGPPSPELPLSPTILTICPESE